MNKLNVGDYVRYEYENIIYLGKIDFISEVMCGLNETLEIEIDNCVESILKKDIIKSSPNIIDLIEVGDYVNGFYVIDKPFNQRIHTEFDDFFEEDIESVVTKEQFENISYKVGE